MSEDAESTTLTSDEQELVSKYKSLGRAVLANDPLGCRALYKAFLAQGRSLESEEVNALGLRWLMNRKTSYNMDVAKFLQELDFNFEQKIVLDQNTESSGRSIPFRLLEDPDDHAVLLELIQNGIYSPNIVDGIGDSLLSDALIAGYMDLSDSLYALGAKVDTVNMAGQTPLHIAASKAAYRAVDWLCRHGIDPTVEDLVRQRASELVPDSLEDWDVDSIYETLENYVVDFQAGNGYTSTAEFDMMLMREIEENTPPSDEEEITDEDFDEAAQVSSSAGITMKI